MKHVCFIKDGKIVAAVTLDDAKVIDDDRKAARGPAVLQHHKILHTTHTDGKQHEVSLGVHEEPFEQVYEPWMHGEEFRDCLMVEIPIELPDKGFKLGDSWTEEGGLVPRPWTAEETAAYAESKKMGCVAELKQTAWTQAPDNPKAFRDAWAKYRKSIRDIMENTTDFSRVNWPERPA